MRNTTRIAAIATVFTALAGIAWLALESLPTRLGFEDTDDPTVMVAFIRQHPDVFAQAGVVLVLVAIGLAVAVLAVGEVLASAADCLTLVGQGRSAFSRPNSSCSEARFAWDPRVHCSIWPVSAKRAAKQPMSRRRSSVGAS